MGVQEHALARPSGRREERAMVRAMTKRLDAAQSAIDSAREKLGLCPEQVGKGMSVGALASCTGNLPQRGRRRGFRGPT